jgi:hypothetical protein
MDVCHSCYNDLVTKGRQPLDSLANFQYYGHEALSHDVRAAFENASLFDIMLVSRARATRITHLFSSKKDSSTYGHDPDLSQRYNRGNVAVFPQDNIRLRDILPPPQEEVAEAMCALFVGGHIQPTRENIAKLKPVLVSKSNVSVMLKFLLACNTWYKGSGVTFSPSNFAALFDDNACDTDSHVPHGVELYHLPMTDASSSKVPDYIGRYSDVDNGADSELVMEAVGYVAGDRSPQNS